MDKTTEQEINRQIERAIHTLGYTSIAIACGTTLLFLICYWRMFNKAGFSGCLSLLMFVPCLNLLVIIWFAFAEWPNMKRARAPKSK